MSRVAAEVENEGSRYRLQHPRLRDMLTDLRIPSRDPGPGDRLPSFDLPTTTGGRFTGEQFDGSGRPVVLIFGSLTCPITESAGPGLARLHRLYGDRVRFVMVNVREAHPGERAWQTSDPDEKARRAAELRLHHGFAFEVATDDVDGSLHRWFGTRPSSAYVIDPHGNLVFRAHWSSATGAIERTLKNVLVGARIARPIERGTTRASIRMLGFAGPALDRGGSTAWRDLWKAAPPLALLISVSSRLRLLPVRRRGGAVVVASAAGAIAAIAVLV